MDRFAERAGIARQASVLADELPKIAAAVPLDPLGDQDVGEAAGQTFDYHAAYQAPSRSPVV